RRLFWSQGGCKCGRWTPASWSRSTGTAARPARRMRQHETAVVVDPTRRFTMTRALLAALAVLLLGSAACALEPIPDKLVVLTFDDSAKSHYTVARPILT